MSRGVAGHDYCRGCFHAGSTSQATGRVPGQEGSPLSGSSPSCWASPPSLVPWWVRASSWGSLGDKASACQLHVGL